MIYTQVYEKSGKKQVAAGLIGSGHYSTALIGQSMFIPMLNISVIAEKNPEVAKKAFKSAGIPEEQIVYCDTRLKAILAMEKKKFVWVEDAMLMMDLPLDIIVEGTGDGETGVRHALAILENGKHLAMLTKEADSIVGPYLKYLADRAGLVYTQVDGDQPAGLIGLVQWARTLGLEILSAGKSPDTELVLDRKNMRISRAYDGLVVDEKNWRSLDADDMEALITMPLDPEGKRKTLARRARILEGITANRDFDICETQVMANALNLEMDGNKLITPVVRAAEIPSVLCPEENGGILHGKERIELIALLRDVDASNMGGGVFAVVTSKNEYARTILNTKGLHHSPDGMASLLPRPFHLCGVETATTLISAGALGISALAGSYLPKFDMHTKTLVPMKAGEKINCGDFRHMETLLSPARAMGPGSPVHTYICHNLNLKQDIPANTIFTTDMVEMTADSILLGLRKKQDEFFGLK